VHYAQAERPAATGFKNKSRARLLAVQAQRDVRARAPLERVPQPPRGLHERDLVRRRPLRADSRRLLRRLPAPTAQASCRAVGAERPVQQGSPGSMEPLQRAVKVAIW